jgi:translation initiation factor 2B subunit (eIF-2B alpha/beta/delta family)
MDLALEAVDLARDWLAAGREPAELAQQLQAMHPAIATVRNVGAIVAGAGAELPRRLTGLRASLVEGNGRIARNLRGLIQAGSAVITLSNSSTVRVALVTLEVGRAYVLESQPGGEGREMAAALEAGLAGVGGTVQLVPDSAMGNVVPEVDCALVGIDAFDPGGAIYHKVGTLPLALCCRHFNKPFYAAGHSLKRVGHELGRLPESDRPLEAQRFDRTPAELITELVSE